MKCLISPKRLTKDIPIESERAAILIATADAIGGIVRISGDFSNLSAFRQALLQLRQSGHVFEHAEEAFYPGLLVAACYSDGKTVFKDAPRRCERLECALRSLGANVTREDCTVTVCGTGGLSGGGADAEENEETSAYLAIAATAANQETIIENAAGEWFSTILAAGGRGIIL